MRNKKHKKDKNTLRAGFLFLSIFIFFILVSIALKGIDVLKNSRFDGEGRFNILVLSNDEKNFLISVSPNNTSTIVEILGENAQDGISARLGVAIDGRISNLQNYSHNPKDFFLKSIFSYPKINTDMTIFDLIRLYFAVGQSPDNFLSIYPSDQESEEIDKLLSGLFHDPKIKREKISIEIVNSAGEQGMAGRMARLIGGMGGDIILLRNSEKSSKHSEVFYHDESYTVKKISEYFDIRRTRSEERGIADIVIIIGEDLIGTDRF